MDKKRFYLEFEGINKARSTEMVEAESILYTKNLSKLAYPNAVDAVRRGEPMKYVARNTENTKEVLEVTYNPGRA